MSAFSVIIPTFNRSDWLREAIRSVLAQGHGDHETIVVDDGSTDSTGDVLKSFETRIIALTQQNLGPGRARNLGATRASGEYLAFLDSDDLFFPWSLETYAQVIRRHDGPSFIAGKPLRFLDEGDLAAASPGDLETTAFHDYLASGDEWRWWGASSFVVRRDAFEAAGGFADVWINGEDADLDMKLGAAPGFVQVLSPVTFGYREHGSNETKNIRRNLDGVLHMLNMEKLGRYPGGESRAAERWRIISRHGRPMVLDCLKQGWRAEAWKLYRAMFRWNAALGNWKFLLGFPLKSAIAR